MKYIDADKLIAEIERRRVILDKYKDSFEPAACCKQELEWMEDFIASLQQEQPEVDLEEEIEKCLKQHNMLAVGKKDFTDLARHFYELGLNTRKKE